VGKPTKRSHKQAESFRRRKSLHLFPVKPPAEALPSPSAEKHSRADSLVKQGIDAFRQNRLDHAANFLLNALALSPSHAFAHNCLGIVRRSQGDIPGAIICYEQALHYAPESIEAYNNLGVACEACGDIHRAASAYESALRIQPKFAAALNNLGNVLTKLNRAEEAVEKLGLALRIQPGFAAAHNNLGLALSRLGQSAEAEECFRKAILYQSQFAEAHVNLGNALRAKRQLDDAAECYRAAIRLRPRYPAALSGLGNTLLDQYLTRDAQRCYEEAVRLDPNFAEAHLGLGNAHLELEQWGEAENCFLRAAQCKQNYAEAFNNLGSTYRAWGKFEKAEATFRDAIRINPELVAAHNNLGNLYRYQDRNDLAAQCYAEVLRRQPHQLLSKLRISTLCPTVFERRSEMDEYLERAQPEWNSLRGACEYRDITDILAVANEPPYNLQFFAENICPLKKAYAEIFRYVGPAFEFAKRREKIRIGCVSTSGHEVAFLRLIWDSLKRMNPEEFELTIICSPGAVTKFQSAVGPTATIIGLHEQANRVVETLREQQFDVLYYFEVCTDAWNYFLPHFRLAPVQVTSWGIQVTSGIPNVDYYLSSALVESAEADEHYSERLIRAKTLLTYQLRTPMPTAAKTRTAFGFSPDEHLYVCAQHLGKFHPDFDLLLAEILRRDPRGKVVGVEDKYGYGANRLRERWKRVIPDVASRIMLLPRMPQSDYMSLLAACDLLLDPTHFGGVSTTYDGFSLCKPIVTLPSSQHRGRYTAGCYARMGLSDCTAKNAEHYVEIATRLAADRDLQDKVSTDIRENGHKIFEDQESVHEHERIFRELVNKANVV
jgi:protein O-GlcNAc transferase